MKYLIRNTHFIDENNHLVDGQDILIEEGIIKSIGKINVDSNAKIIDGSKYLILPGLMNAHFHLGETIFRGYAPNDSLKKYLEYCSRFSQQLKSEKAHYTISKFSLFESVSAGTTTISCARGWLATEETKVRGVLGYPLMKSDKLSQYYECFASNFTKMLEDFPKKFESGNIQISLGLWIHSLCSLDEEELNSISEVFLSNKNLNLMIHVAETIETATKVRERFGGTEIQVLHRYGLLSDRTNLVHVNHITDEDVKLIANNNSNVTICPSSNIFLKTGLPRLRKIIDPGINISIGTDGLATNYSASLIDSARTTYFAFRDLDLEPGQLLDMITKNPTKTLGLERCGSIKENYFADLVFYDINNFPPDLLENALKYLIFGRSIIPTHVMVDGNFVIKDNYFPDQDDIKVKFNELVARIKLD